MLDPGVAGPSCAVRVLSHTIGDGLDDGLLHAARALPLDVAEVLVKTLAALSPRNAAN